LVEAAHRRAALRPEVADARAPELVAGLLDLRLHDPLDVALELGEQVLAEVLEHRAVAGVRVGGDRRVDLLDRAEGVELAGGFLRAEHGRSRPTRQGRAPGRASPW